MRRGPAPATGGTTGAAPRRRFDELALIMLAGLIGAGGYLLTVLSEKTGLTGTLAPRLAIVLLLLFGAHIAVRRLAPDADPTLLPIAALLNALGFVFIARLDESLASAQTVWAAVGVVVFVATLMLVRDTRALERYRYTFALIGIVTLLLPIVPGLGREVNGARLWIQLGPLNFQPAEIAKVVLAIFLAAYLVEKREVLEYAPRRILGVPVPAARHLGPLLLAWGASLVIMIQEKDLGSSLLFFALFVVMVYVATGRGAYLGIGAGMFAVGATAAYMAFSHVGVRVRTWIDPWPFAQGQGFQLVQSLYAFGSGGFAGTGFGLGSPDKIPNAATDFVFAAIGEELGLLGCIGVLAAYVLLVGSGMRIAVRTDRPFAKMLAAGLTVILGIQTFIILGGVTRVIPLTGITLPFVSYGGSSLVANFALLAILLRISDETGRRQREEAEVTSAGVGVGGGR